ncbi:hypothetical protein UFOVP37_27 [uncultured Caudovirales phage]|uniref:Uncharacterized protein n=1 Tax=uncultured Caudovirales phage TaxID=2100421 RepID=A0A6J5KLC4_9CAUD|nr:hypothetical protein UFOVP37_27 [uncultured Caudovirales phage]
MADPYVGAARAALGQGLGMGWGDEGEAWLRSKLGGVPYEQALKQIRQEYAQYSKEYPVTSTAAEFAGGVAPAVGMMFVPGAQPAGAAQMGASTMGALAKLAALGGATGAVSGAGSAEEGGRLSGAATGGTLGTILGVGTPVVMRGTTGAARWLRDRIAPSEAAISQRAGEKMTQAMRESNLTPQQIEQMMAKDRAMGVPGVVANTDAAMADLAEAVAQRTGKGTRNVEKTLTQQKTGARERTYQQVRKGLNPGNYYADEERLVKELRNKAGDVYENAYAHGDVDDPRIVEALKNPRFQEFFNKARSIAETEGQAAKLRGEDASRFALPELYKPTGKFTDSGAEILELTKLPDVRTLDYIKRGIDATIDSGFKGQGMSTAEASALRSLRKEFVNAIDENVPAYKAARQSYAGDMEVIDAMRAGMNDFNKLDHEQVIKMVSGMGDAEKDAFRTGVARHLYSTVMDPSTNFNAANRIINSPETVAKLQPLFDSPSQFRLFQTAMERESQLFHQANKILGGSQTAKRGAMRESLDEGPGVGDAISAAVTGGGFGSTLANITLKSLRNKTITPQVADKLSDMLMAKDPSEVAAVVKFLEEHAAGQAPRAVRGTAAERGAVMGSTSTVWPAPQEDQPIPEQPNIDADISAQPAPGISSIEADIEAAGRK